MKKSYLTLAAVAAIMASCSNEVLIDEPVVNDVEIGFAQSFIDKTTKAELTNEWFQNDDENSFGVYGYKGSLQIYGKTDGTTAEEVKWNKSSKDWEHSTVRFWDKAANDYEFYAYAPYGQAAKFTSKKFTFESIVANPIAVITADNADLAIANPLTGISYDKCTKKTADGHGNGHVEFIFNHILSKLSFNVKTSLEIGSDKAVTALSVKEIKLDFPTATKTSWNQTDAGAVAGTTTFDAYAEKNGIGSDGKPVAANYETSVYPKTTDAANATQAVTSNAAAIGNQFIVAPVNGTNGEHVFGVRVLYTITYKDGVSEDCVAYGVIGGGNGSAGTTQYKPTQNSNYVVTLNINPETIEFCVDKINDWNAETAVGPVDVK